jgi:hypothetical protein
MKWHYDGPQDTGNGALIHYSTGDDGTGKREFRSYAKRERDTTWYVSGIDGDSQPCASHAEALRRRQSMIAAPK